MDGQFAPRRKGRTISVVNLILIILIIGLIAAGFLSYLRYRNLGESPVDKLGLILNKKPRFLFNIYGSKDNLLKAPMAVSAGKEGNIFVANTEGHTVEVFDSTGKHIFSFGGYGTVPGKMSFPYGITEDSHGNILVAESGNGRIQVFDSNGTFVKVLLDKENKKVGLQKPGPLYRDSGGRIYVGDLITHNVVVISETGSKLGSFTGVLYPHGITSDEKGRVYISDSGNNQVVVFDGKGNRLSKISTWNSDRPFSMIRGIALNPKGEIFIPDTMAGQIRVFDSNYKYLYSFGAPGMENGFFMYPSGIHVDRKGKIYITDWGNNRIQVWSY